MTFDNSNDGMIHVTYAHKDLEGEYLVMMITATEGKDGFTMADPGDQTIKYIDQMTAKDVGGTPTIEFDVYPSSISNSIIVIYGVMPDGSKSLKAAIVDAKYVIGDVNSDTYIDANDALLILQFRANIEGVVLSDNDKSAADVNSDGYIDSNDALMILQYRAGIIDSLS